MAFRLKFSTRALREIGEAKEWYELQSPGLGEEFRAEFQRMRELVMANPHRCAPDSRGRRRALINRFPYKLIYKIRAQDIFLLAAAHSKRAPSYWESRDRD